MEIKELRKELREVSQRMIFHREERERHQESFKRCRERRAELRQILQAERDQAAT